MSSLMMRASSGPESSCRKWPAPSIQVMNLDTRTWRLSEAQLAQPRFLHKQITLSDGTPARLVTSVAPADIAGQAAHARFLGV